MALEPEKNMQTNKQTNKKNNFKNKTKQNITNLKKISHFLREEITNT